jgi:hypothetical protein
MLKSFKKTYILFQRFYKKPYNKIQQKTNDKVVMGGNERERKISIGKDENPITK